MAGGVMDTDDAVVVYWVVVVFLVVLSGWNP